MKSRLMAVGKLACAMACAALPSYADGSCGGYAYSTAFTMTKSTGSLTVIGKSTIGGVTINPCNFYTENRITSPTTRSATGVSAENHSYNAGSAEAISELTVGLDDGNYTGHATFSTEDETTVPFTYQTPAAIERALYVNGFVQITSTSWTPSSVSKTGSSALTCSCLLQTTAVVS